VTRALGDRGVARGADCGGSGFTARSWPIDVFRCLRLPVCWCERGVLDALWLFFLVQGVAPPAGVFVLTWAAFALVRRNRSGFSREVRGAVRFMVLSGPITLR